MMSFASMASMSKLRQQRYLFSSLIRLGTLLIQSIGLAMFIKCFLERLILVGIECEPKNHPLEPLLPLTDELRTRIIWINHPHFQNINTVEDPRSHTWISSSANSKHLAILKQPFPYNADTFTTWVSTSVLC